MERLTQEKGHAIAGQLRTVMVDRLTPESGEWAAAGRTEGQAWETDGEVLVESGVPAASPGDLVSVTVTGARGFDITARLKNSAEERPRPPESA
jgi:hypothetical protein